MSDPGRHPGRCPECGQPLAAGTTCTERFHALLVLESRIPGGPGELAHFLAVASYGVQHPESMGYTEQTLTGMRDALRDVVSGSATVADVRRRARYLAARAGRVTRRPGDAIPAWGPIEWPVTVGDVLEAGPERYGSSVERWARSIVATLAEREPMTAERMEG